MPSSAGRPRGRDPAGDPGTGARSPARRAAAGRTSLAELEALRPEVIVAVGAVAARAVLGASQPVRLPDDHGRRFRMRRARGDRPPPPGQREPAPDGVADLSDLPPRALRRAGRARRLPGGRGRRGRYLDSGDAYLVTQRDPPSTSRGCGSSPGASASPASRSRPASRGSSTRSWASGSGWARPGMRPRARGRTPDRLRAAPLLPLPTWLARPDHLPRGPALPVGRPRRSSRRLPMPARRTRTARRRRPHGKIRRSGWRRQK